MVLLILTENSDKSVWVEDEIKRARKLDKIVAPFSNTDNMGDFDLYKKYFMTPDIATITKDSYEDLSRQVKNQLKVAKEKEEDW